MKQTKTIATPPVPAQPAGTKQTEDGYTCDKCKKHYPRAGEHSTRGIDWSGDSWGDVTATCVQRLTGSSWPEGTHLTGREWHICLDCFKSWLEPILVAECGDGTELDIDY